jgi:predicted PurR-regulated permease PerM
MNDNHEICSVLKSKSYLKNTDSDDIYEKVGHLLSFGYIYNPYGDKFFNPFFDGLPKVHSRSLSDSWLIYFNQIVSNIRRIKSLKKTNEAIIQQYSRKTNHLLQDIIALSGFIGIILFIICLLSFFFLSIKFVIIISIVGLFFSKHYIIYNTLVIKYFGEWEAAPVWKKYKILFFIILMLNFFVLIYFLYKLSGSFLIAIILGVLINIVSSEVSTFIEEKYYLPQSVFNTLYNEDYMYDFNKTLEDL